MTLLEPIRSRVAIVSRNSRYKIKSQFKFRLYLKNEWRVERVLVHASLDVLESPVDGAGLAGLLGRQAELGHLGQVLLAAERV
jgi:hypothetical protein